MKKKDGLQEYFDLIFTCPFSFGLKFPNFDVNSLKFDDSGVSSTNIDGPFEVYSKNKSLHKMSEEQLENFLKEIEKQPENIEKEFVRNDRERRKTIAIETIAPHEPTEFRRFRTNHREEDGIIEEIDSSEEHSKPDNLNNYTDESNDYDELNKILNQENENVIRRISTLRLAVSRQNTIESIRLKEKRKTSPAMTQGFQKFMEKPDDLKSIERSSFNSNSPVVSESLASLEFQESKIVEQVIGNDRKEENFESKNEKNNFFSIGQNDNNKHPIITSFIEKEPLTRLEAKKSVKLRSEIPENISENIEFSSITSKESENQSFSENPLVNIEVSKKNDEKFTSEASETSSIPSSKTPIIQSKKSGKIFPKFEDSGLSYNESEYVKIPTIQAELKNDSEISQEKAKNLQPVIDLSSNKVVRETENFYVNKSKQNTILPSIKQNEVFRASNSLITSKSLNKVTISKKLSIKNIEIDVVNSQDLKPEEKALKAQKMMVNALDLIIIKPDSLNTNKIKEKIPQDFFDLEANLTEKKLSSQKSPDNIEVFGAHVSRMPRTTNLDPITSPRSLTRQKLEPIGQVPKAKTETLSITKSEEKLSPEPAYSILFTQEKLLFMYYLELIGHPSAPKSTLNHFSVGQHITPNEVISINKRLNIRVSSVPYSSIDSDFA